MPTARPHAAVLRMPCASGKTYTVRRDLVDVAKMSLVVVVTCNRLFTKATCKDWAAVYGEENVFCYLDGLGKSEAARVQNGVSRRCVTGAQASCSYRLRASSY